MHCGYHLTTSIVAPALLSLPFALASLGWAPGVACLVVGAVVTFYSYNLLSLVLDHYAQLGRRQLRFRDMAHDILGNLILIFDILSIRSLRFRHSPPVDSVVVDAQSSTGNMAVNCDIWVFLKNSYMHSSMVATTKSQASTWIKRDLLPSSAGPQSN